MKTKGYSIWLIPKGNIYKKLSNIIGGLSLQHSSPIFEPHVTLLGGIIGNQEEIIANTKKLALIIKPYKVQLAGVDFIDYYLKALFLKAIGTKSVLKPNEKTCAIFKMKNNGEYLPHLSLIYGDFPEALKKEVIENENLRSLKANFIVDMIYLFKTEGEVRDWKKIAEFKLTSN